MRLDPQVKERLKKSLTAELVAQKQQVTVFSPYPLSENEMKDIVSRFPRFNAGNPENKIDSSLIGGFVIQSGSELVDLSIRNALHLLKKHLYESN